LYLTCPINFTHSLAGSQAPSAMLSVEDVRQFSLPYYQTNCHWISVRTWQTTKDFSTILNGVVGLTSNPKPSRLTPGKNVEAVS